MKRPLSRRGHSVGIAAAGAPSQAPGSGPKWFGKKEWSVYSPTHINADSIAADTSPDGEATTSIFSTLEVGVEKNTTNNKRKGAEKKAAEMSAVRTATLRRTFILPDEARLAAFTNDIRGFINKSKGGRACLIVDVGGTTEILDFPTGKEQAEEFQLSVISPVRREAKGSGPNRLPLPEFVLNLVLIVQRCGDDDHAVLTVDTVDTEIAVAGSGGKPKPPKT